MRRWLRCDRESRGVKAPLAGCGLVVLCFFGMFFWYVLLCFLCVFVRAFFFSSFFLYLILFVCVFVCQLKFSVLKCFFFCFGPLFCLMCGLCELCICFACVF